jgi:hypothetical protein
MVNIYVLIDPRDNQIRYVGQTKSPPATRLCHHICLAKKGCQYYSARWIRELLRHDLKPLVQLIEVTDRPDEREAYWIVYYRSQGARLTNYAAGGPTTRGTKHGPLSPQMRAKLSLIHTGKPKSPEARANMRKPKSPEAIRNMSAAQKGRKKGPPSEEHRRKLSAALKGRKKSPEHIAKYSAAQKGKFIPDELRARWSASQKGRPAPPRAPDHYKKAWETRRRNQQAKESQ